MELILYLTNNCNMKCKYCYENNYKGNKAIDLKIIKSLLQKEIKSQDKISKITFLEENHYFKNH
ncbi:MAG: hypothetical protein IJ220_00540 [Clostridia bacterium]|nr:hypothetical protein [Clostridia bacterium]